MSYEPNVMLVLYSFHDFFPNKVLFTSYKYKVLSDTHKVSFKAFALLLIKMGGGEGHKNNQPTPLEEP